MKALQIVKARDVQMVEVQEPQITAPDGVKVHVEAVSICNMHEWKSYTDHYERHFKAEYPLDPGYPGHEGMGEVIEVGDAVRNIEVGDKVFLTSRGGHLHTEYVVAPAEWAFKVNRDADPADAAMGELVSCAIGLFEKAEYLSGCRVALSGLGPGGMANLQVLRVWYPSEIVAVDLLDDRLQMALDMGADQAVNANDKDAVEELIASEPETAIDCSGNHGGLKFALRAARREALLFTYNDQPFEVMQADWFWKQMVIRTGNIVNPRIARKAAAMLRRGLVQPSKLVTHRVPFSAEGYAEAMDLVERKVCLKVLMEH